MSGIVSMACTVTGWLDRLGAFLPQLGLRLFLAWEFWESGLEKFHGDNWFAEVRGRFPFPFDQLPPEVSWQLAMWTELVGAVGIALGLGTRFWALAFIVLDVVAWTAVHAGHGYNVCSGGWKLPLIYLLMLLPLLLQGPGRASLDHLMVRALAR